MKEINLSRYNHLLQAIEEERLEEERYFLQIKDAKSANERIHLGMMWYPVKIQSMSYTLGDYIEIVVKKENIQNHKFTNGKAVYLFNQQDTKTEIKGVVDFVRGDTMRIVIHDHQLKDWDIFDKGLNGVELIYDDKPYRIMQKAVEDIMVSKSSHITVLRDSLVSKVVNTDALPLLPAREMKIRNNLNDAQNLAVAQMLNAPLLGIVHGPPGTGKTTTVIEILKNLLKYEKRVLVCASSNNAVDLLVERSAAAGLNVLRVGNMTRVSEELKHLTIDEKVRNHLEWANIRKVKLKANEIDNKARQFKRSFGQVEAIERRELRKEARDMRSWARELEDRLVDEIIHNCEVVASTLIGASNNLIKNLRFKTVIIDEASQALEPECWNAILKAERVILVGDHKQLPPTVKSKKAMKLGLSDTILDHMIDQLQCNVLLDVQYRMHESILGFSNLNYYGGRLKSADANQYRTLRNDNLPLVYIDTVGCGFEEEYNTSQSSYNNPGEYFIITEFIKTNFEKLLGVSIAIISPYAAQVKYINKELSGDVSLEALTIRVSTIDGFQGQESEVVFISLARSNEKGEIGFLKDERRLNVALTRAQKKLIIVGDSATLCNYKTYKELIEYVETYGHYDSAWNYMQGDI